MFQSFETESFSGPSSKNNSVSSSPENKLEYEITYNLVKSDSHEKDQSNLQAIINHPVIAQNSCQEFIDLLCHSKYYRPAQWRHAMRTNPVTWYMDTADLDLRARNVNFRCRVTPYLPDHFELAVKGKAQAFNGPGGLLRHEDELHTARMVLDPTSFTDAVSTELLVPAHGKDTYFFFASDVERTLVSFMAEINGKRAIAEAAFDDINYIVQTNNPDQPLASFYRLCQIETEYVNPASSVHQAAAKRLGLGHLDKDEVEQLLKMATNRIEAAVSDLAIAIEPSDLSKGCIGFEQLAKYQGREKAVPAVKFPAHAPISLAL